MSVPPPGTTIGPLLCCHTVQPAPRPPVASRSEKGNFTVRNQPFQPGYCTDPNKFEAPTFYTYTFGTDSGTFRIDGPEACSPQQPPQVCRSAGSSRFRHCDCDLATCTDAHNTTGCCFYVGNETLSAVFTFYTLKGDQPGESL